jgi:hypothetical protein
MGSRAGGIARWRSISLAGAEFSYWYWYQLASETMQIHESMLCMDH